MKHSKIIQRHLWLWGLVVSGFLVLILASPYNFLVALVGLALSVVSLLLAMNSSIKVQNEAKYLYLNSFGDEAGRVQLKRVFFLARSAFLVFGIALLAGTFLLWGISAREFVEIEGKIRSIEPQENGWQIQLEGDAHRYVIRASSKPDEDLDSILANVEPGDPVSLLIKSEEDDAPSDPHIVIDDLRTGEQEFSNTLLHGDAFDRVIKNSAILGVVVSILGGIYLFTGDIRQRMRVC
jgi:hypothetical protein